MADSMAATGFYIRGRHLIKNLVLKDIYGEHPNQVVDPMYV